MLRAVVTVDGRVKATFADNTVVVLNAAGNAFTAFPPAPVPHHRGEDEAGGMAVRPAAVRQLTEYATSRCVFRRPQEGREIRNPNRGCSSAGRLTVTRAWYGVHVYVTIPWCRTAPAVRGMCAGAPSLLCDDQRTGRRMGSRTVTGGARGRRGMQVRGHGGTGGGPAQHLRARCVLLAAAAVSGTESTPRYTRVLPTHRLHTRLPVTHRAWCCGGARRGSARCSRRDIP
jgi:hypothetical protein